jgi:hypothetical protein
MDGESEQFDQAWLAEKLSAAEASTNPCVTTRSSTPQPSNAEPELEFQSSESEKASWSPVMPLPLSTSNPAVQQLDAGSVDTTLPLLSTLLIIAAPTLSTNGDLAPDSTMVAPSSPVVHSTMSTSSDDEELEV